MKYTISAFTLVLCLWAVMVMSALAQDSFFPSQQTKDAVQDYRLDQAEARNALNSQNLLQLANQFSDMKSSLDKFSGIGIGFGLAIGGLQVLNLVVQLRKSKL